MTFYCMKLLGIEGCNGMCCRMTREWCDFGDARRAEGRGEVRGDFKISTVGSRENFVNREKGDRVGKEDKFGAKCFKCEATQVDV